MLEYTGCYIGAGSGNLRLHSRCFEAYHQHCDALVWSRMCGLCDEQRPLLKHIADPMGNFFPSISAEMLALDAYTHVHRTKRTSMINSHSCEWTTARPANSPFPPLARLRRVSRSSRQGSFRHWKFGVRLGIQGQSHFPRSFWWVPSHRTSLTRCCDVVIQNNTGPRIQRFS